MKHIPSWEANSRWASLEISRLLRNHKVHHRVHKSRDWSLASSREFNPHSHSLFILDPF
jgi:hypothetical protein